MILIPDVMNVNAVVSHVAGEAGFPATILGHPAGIILVNTVERQCAIASIIEWQVLYSCSQRDRETAPCSRSAS
jgi:hypothetical protein